MRRGNPVFYSISVVSFWAATRPVVARSDGVGDDRVGVMGGDDGGGVMGAFVLMAIGWCGPARTRQGL